jgi:hypothetical protein
MGKINADLSPSNGAVLEKCCEGIIDESTLIVHVFLVRKDVGDVSAGGSYPSYG